MSDNTFTSVNNSTSADYSAKIKSSPEFATFNEKYIAFLDIVKRNIDSLVNVGSPINPKKMINYVFDLINCGKTKYQILDILQNLEVNDEPIYHHSINVAVISIIIGMWTGMPDEDLRILALAGILHDIGKVAVPAEVLNKQGKLTDEEFALIKSHVKTGYDILRVTNLDSRVIESSLLHHERCDGSGYLHYTGEKIPAFSKIIAIADVYEAMTSSRTYRKGRCPFDVIKIFDDEGLNKYDPQYIMTFLKNIVEAHLHSNVRLSDGRTGEIIMINTLCLYKPIIVCTDGSIADLLKLPDVKIEAVI